MIVTSISLTIKKNVSLDYWRIFTRVVFVMNLYHTIEKYELYSTMTIALPTLKSKPWSWVKISNTDSKYQTVNKILKRQTQTYNAA